MFEHQFGLRENPFAAGHQPRFVYPSREHQEALAHLRYGIENREPFVLITGEVGTGKTTALYDVLSEWQSRVTVALITNSALTRDELLEEICVRFGIGVAAGASKPQLLMLLERHLMAVRARGERAILLLDEAQNLDRSLLEEIRLLSNLEAAGEKLTQVFLVGQPELETILSRPELRQLRQRIAVHYRLHPLNEDDTERYIHHRITVAGGHALTIFPADACREVHAITHGIPREINTVCSQSMLNAFVEDLGVVLPEHVRAVASETEFQSVIRGASRATQAAGHVPEPAASEPVPTAAEPAPPMAEPKPAPPIAAPDAEARESSAGHSPEAEGAPPQPVSHLRPGPAAVKPAGTQRDWESWRSALSFGGGSASHRETRDMPAPPSPAPFEEISHESEAATVHSQQAVSWYGPEPEPPTRASPPDPSPVLSEQDMTPEPPTRPEPARPASTPMPPATSQQPSRPASPSPPPAPSQQAPRPASPAPPQAPRPVATSLPPSLRRKLEFDEDEAKESGVMNWLAIGGVVIVLIAVGVFAVRWLSSRKPAAAPPAAVSQTAPSAEPVTPADSMPKPPVTTPATSATTAASAAKPPAAPAANASAATSKPAASTSTPPTNPPATSTSKPAAGAAGTATTTDAAKPKTEATASRYGIVVATYIDESRANEERDKLGAATGLAATVQSVQDGGDTVYRVVLGSFTSRATADREAGKLIDAGKVNEARVVAIPR